MKIHCYSESPAAGLGGSEHCVITLAEWLSQEHEVTILHHKPSAAFRAMAELAGADLHRVNLRYLAPQPDLSATCATPWARARAAKAWHQELSAGSDLFVAFLHQRPPFCHAARGVLVVLFPTFQPFPVLRRKAKAGGVEAPRRGMFRWKPLERLYTAMEWRRRLGTYRAKCSISEFTRSWVRERWRVESQLLSPPVETSFATGPQKDSLILSVGRFATGGCRKKQAELIGAFGQLAAELPAWRYASVGSLSDSAVEQAFYEELRTLASARPVEVRANLTRAELRSYFERASLFWHAAGLDEEADRRPERLEHFGIVTVEAMAAGCVPLVINRGAQPELVEHGISGWVWNTLPELLGYTRALAADPARREQMAAAARARAERFSRERFFDNFRALALSPA